MLDDLWLGERELLESGDNVVVGNGRHVGDGIEAADLKSSR
jgi:hypothetical protein